MGAKSHAVSSHQTGDPAGGSGSGGNGEWGTDCKVCLGHQLLAGSLGPLLLLPTGIHQPNNQTVLSISVT